MRTRREPLSWYVGKLERGEPFSSLLYGDGEFTAMHGDTLGVPFTQYREVVTPSVRREMLASLDAPGDDVLRASDFFILDPDTYHGNDKATIREVGRRVRAVVGGRDVEWLDGTVWDAAARSGELAPLLRALHAREVVLVANRRLESLAFLHAAAFVPVPDRDACGALDALERGCLAFGRPAVYLVCAGLAAVPLIMRLRARMPGGTFLDLGSTLDVFVGLGAERGWRRELYADPPRLRELLARNLEGVCPEGCTR